MQSVFTDKIHKPSNKDLEHALGKTSALWSHIVQFTEGEYPGAVSEWNYPGAKYGWSFRIKDKKRVIIYLLPRAGFFKCALVFGDKALALIFAGDISEAIKDELRSAKKYAEGTGVRIDVRKKSDLKDILKLIQIKLSV